MNLKATESPKQEWPVAHVELSICVKTSMMNDFIQRVKLCSEILKVKRERK